MFIIWKHGDKRQKIYQVDAFRVGTGGAVKTVTGVFFIISL